MHGWVDTQAINDSLAAFGLKQDAPSVTHFDIWPENHAAFNLFCSLQSQWHVGPGGAIGLNYQSLQLLLHTQGVPPAEHAHIIAGVQILEFETLRLWRQR